MNTLFYGGSFNPIGNHHLLLAEQAAEVAGYDKVVFMPVYDAPHKTGLADFKHRFEMCRIATAYHGSKFEVSKLEQELYEQYGRKSFTIETVRALKGQEYDPVDLLVGSDSFDELDKWHQAWDLVKEARFLISPRYPRSAPMRMPRSDPIQNYATIIRNLGNLSVISVSSTMIRERCQKGMSLRFYVPRGVEQYIVENGLYNEDTSGNQKDGDTETAGAV